MEIQKRIPELDGVRGWALLMVIIVHNFVQIAHPPPSTPLSYLQLAFATSYSAVDLFFVLSGFLIGGILLDNRGSHNYFRVFYARRFFRIFPLYYLILTVFAIALAMGGQRLDQSGYVVFGGALPFWSYLTYTQNFVIASLGTTFGCYGLGVTWSLAIEEQFYVLAPLVMRRISDKTLTIGLIALILIAYLSRLVLASNGEWVTAVYVLTFCRFDSIAFGILGALIVRRVKLNRSLLYASWGLMAVVMVIMIKQRTAPASIGIVYYGYTSFALFYLLTILLTVTHSRGPLARFFRFSPFRYFGQIAYCAYLLHVPINALCHSIIRHQVPTLANFSDTCITALAFVLTVVIARLSWLYFERPLLLRGQKYHYALKPEDESLHAPARAPVTA